MLNYHNFTKEGEFTMLDITLDGGGTKLNGILFDEDFNVVRRARSGGVNATQNGKDAAEKSVSDCLDALIPSDVSEVGTVYATFVGDCRVLTEVLGKRIKFNKLCLWGEDYSGLLAGAGYHTGLLALAGTGSDVFNVHKDKTSIVGGFGPIVGDQGGGEWIGIQAIRALGRDIAGWGEKTSLTNAIMEKYETDGQIFRLIDKLHSSSTPYAMAASLVPLVGKSAFAEDKVALEILSNAGIAMAKQMLALLRIDPIIEHKTVVLCGGSWKSHPIMKKSFEDALHAVYPELVVQRPWFEHVVAGMMEKALLLGYSRDEAHAMLKEKCTEESLEEMNKRYECY